MKELKTLPYSTTKKTLVEMFLDQMSEKRIRKAVNEIIKDFNISNKNVTTIRSRNIPHVIFKEFILTYGAPKGYKQPDAEFQAY